MAIVSPMGKIKEPRPHRLHINLSDAEQAAVEELCERSGATPGRLLGKLALAQLREEQDEVPEEAEGPGGELVLDYPDLPRENSRPEYILCRHPKVKDLRYVWSSFTERLAWGSCGVIEVRNWLVGVAKIRKAQG